MSSLLEQAIVDATALRQAAIKNAEKDLVEKYSNQIKEAVDKLLEQEMAQETAPEEDPMDVASSLENTPTDLKKDTKSGVEQQLIKKVPDSYMVDDDQKLIEIDFSELSKETPEVEASETPETPAGAGMLPVTPVPAMGAAPSATPAAAPAAPPLAESMMYDEGEDGEMDEGDDELAEDYNLNAMPESLDEEDMFEFYESDLEEGGVGFGEPEGKERLGGGLYNDMEETLASLVNGGPADAESIRPAQGPEIEMEEDIHVSLDEEEEHYDEDLSVDFGEQEEMSMMPEYGELEEEITVEVDTNNVPLGERGATSIKTKQGVANELARKKDDKYKLELKQLQDAIETSDKEIANVKEKNKSLKKENLELKNLLRSLKEHIEEMNLSNAKLLYTNRALEDVSLNERQKKTIVESISKTTTIESAKIAFETLQSAVQSAKTEVKAPKSLNEAVSRSSSPFLVRPRASQQENSYSERMKKLAGIIKQ